MSVPVAPANKYQFWDGSQWVGSEKTLSQRYGDFRVAMLNSNGWQRIKATGTVAAPEFMAAIAYMDDNPMMVKYLWNRIINSLELMFKHTVSEVLEWKGIVGQIQIGIDWIGDRESAFDFTGAGLMI
jgi:hypothetical protein